MKRVSALIVAVMIAVFSIPQLRVHAEGSGIVGFYTQESIGTIFSDTTLQEDLDLVIMTNETFNTAGFLNFLEENVDIPENHFITCSVGNGYAISVFDLTDVQGFTYFSATSTSFRGTFYGMDEEWVETYNIPYTTYYIHSDYVEEPINNSSSCTDFYPWGTNVGKATLGSGYLLHSTVPVFSLEQAASLGCPGTISGASADTNQNVWMVQNYTSLTDVRGSGAVYNGSEIIDPSVPDVAIEDISNHLYAKDFDIFFAQSSSNMSNGSAFDSIGGGYLVFKYTLDDYAKTHINDMFLSVNYSVHFDNEQYTGAYQGRLDPSGYTIVALKDAFQNSPYWAKTHFLGLFVQKNAFYQNFHKMDIMSFSTDTWAQLYSYANNNSGGSAPANMAGAIDNYVKGLLNKYTGFYFGYDGNGVVEGLYDFWDALRANMIENPGTYQSAYFTGTAIIQNNADILNTSGFFTNKIDFKTGVTSVIDNGITINENPFEDISPYDIVPYSPDDLVQYGSNGGAYATVGNIVNQITIPGYKELKADIDANPDGNFTQFLAPFYNNEVGSWFFSFVNDMPPEMKTILISGCGVGVLFGIARYVRRS